MIKNPEKELRAVLKWAKLKIDAGQEPPWAWYNYMKLVEAIEATLKGLGSAAVHHERIKIVDEKYSDKVEVNLPM